MVRATGKEKAKRVGKYMIRPILSLKRLSFDETERRVSYQYGKDRADEEQMKKGTFHKTPPSTSYTSSISMT
jgi:hypothetical protein